MGSPTVIVRACIISLSQTSGCVGWVAHRLLVSCSVLGVAVKPVLLTYLREVSTTARVALAFYASSVDSGSASGWVRYGFVQTVAPLASAFLALESARLSSKAKLARAGHAR